MEEKQLQGTADTRETEPAPLESKEDDFDISEWVNEYGDRLFNFAMMRLKNRELAEDTIICLMTG